MLILNLNYTFLNNSSVFYKEILKEIKLIWFSFYFVFFMTLFKTGHTSLYTEKWIQNISSQSCLSGGQGRFAVNPNIYFFVCEGSCATNIFWYKPQNFSKWFLIIKVTTMISKSIDRGLVKIPVKISTSMWSRVEMEPWWLWVLERPKCTKG